MNFPKDQYEAAQSVGMRAGLRFRRIVLPQICASSLPGLVNEMSLLIKVTPVLAVVGVVDITRAAVRIGAETYEPLPPFLVALAIYMPIVYRARVAAALDRAPAGARRGGAHDPRFRRRLERTRPAPQRAGQHGVLSLLAAIAALVLGVLLIAAADVAAQRALAACCAAASSTPCAASRSCCSPTSSITACPRVGISFDNWSAGPGCADDLQHRLHGGDPARRLGGSADASRSTRARLRLYRLAALSAASSCRRCCCRPAR